MAHYYRALEVTATQEQAFDYIADFTHAVWDPATLACAKVTDGLIDVGTTFVLKAKSPIGSIDMPYTITEYEPHRRLVLEGESRMMRWVDVITCESTKGGTLVGYDASLTLRGILNLGDLFLRPMFKRFGDDATDGLIEALDGLA
jgi:hypothetical protein